jgi:hypothetical protein
VRRPPTVLDLTQTQQIALYASLGVTAIAWAVFILTPAWTSYGRLWERIAASFLTLFILASLLGLGVVLGIAVIYVYAGNA